MQQLHRHFTSGLFDETDMQSVPPQYLILRSGDEIWKRVALGVDTTCAETYVSAVNQETVCLEDLMLSQEGGKTTT